jgi:hypothetical protein
VPNLKNFQPAKQVDYVSVAFKEDFSFERGAYPEEITCSIGILFSACEPLNRQYSFSGRSDLKVE